MNNPHGNTKTSQVMLVVFVLFLTILLREYTTGTLSSTWLILTVTGATIIGLPLLAKFLFHKKGSDILNDR